MRYPSSSLLFAIAAISASCGGGGSTEPPGSSDRAVVSADVVPVTFSGQPAGKSQSAFTVFEFSSPSASAYQCALNDGAFVACTSPYVAKALRIGTNTLDVRAVAADAMVSESRRQSWTTVSVFGDTANPTAHADLTATSVQPAPVADASWRGIFRINCDLAHTDYDDPIVFPGQDGAAHLHRFYGNVLVSENTTTDSLVITGDSSCQGNTLNRSSYWVPALLAPAYESGTGQRLTDVNGDPAWQVVPAVVGNDSEAHEIFYYSAGVDDLDSIRPIPTGLKMIAGNMMAMPGAEQVTSIVRWHCQSWNASDGSNPRWSTSVPECVAPDRVRMDVFFPSCWNGVDLDSPDHKSHLAYPVNDGGPNGTRCPDSHPVPIIRVSFHYAYGVKPEVYDPSTRSSRGWRLASDMYSVSPSSPGGMSLHADWFNAWHPEVLEAVIDGCIRRQLDCHDGNLANGFRLAGTRPGAQTMPAVIR